MVKFVITEDAMSPIAQALSGQSRMAGVAAGLKNQMLGLELDKMREERQQAQQQRQMRENLIPSRISRLFPQLSEGARNILAGQLTGQKPEQGVPSDLFQYQADRYAAEHAMTLPQWANAQRYADAIQMNNAFGGNGLEAIKGIGLAQDNANKEYYDMAAREALESGNRDMANQAIAARNGDVYSPYSTGPDGSILNRTTGQYTPTTAYTARIGEINSRTNLNQVNTALSGARITTEELRQQGLAIDNHGKLVRLEELHNPQAKPPSQVYKPLPAAAVESIFNMDNDAYQAFRLEMARKGYADENEYLPIYLREMEGRKAAGNIVGNAMGGASANSPTAQAALNSAGNPSSTWQRGLQAVLPAIPGGSMVAGGLGLANGAAPQSNVQPAIPVPLKPEAPAGQPPATPMPYLDARFNRSAVNTQAPSAAPGFSWMLTDNIRNPRLPEKAVDSSKYIDNAPAGGWLNPNLGNAALESNKQMLFTRLGITPNMTPEQIEQQIVLGISKNMIDDASASQLNRMLFGQ
jgi:hypothetical protein